MRYSPYESEYAAVQDMTAGELLDYFLLRIVETEEVWGISSGEGWMVYQQDGQTIMPMWPYERYAAEKIDETWSNCQSVSVSLEYFIYEMLETLVADDVMIEVLPRINSQPGCLASPHRLQDILEGILDAGTYTLDS